mmetsp:Transcript_37637/g.82427  ORF Transcript_37637/g.82427 Transcript_37637/m.82427 type:complete len:652 (-) Transcript_37637:1350-3305(-)|eukprot:CAMPEP_0178490416 /NCGR_PEP_ID=MMETSP0696-20121128/10880_1 /TAXON_ID=265572 /ORGANISM="Extubocellulus spinifer, Strain CCMP396" /LENGTH=651 /DNA_ID=CAMNT_0020118247 /DNA_START=71 /DNA_END=2026 /DNA_ORIENTATION=-
MGNNTSTVYEEVGQQEDEEVGQPNNEESTYIGYNPRASVLLDARPAYDYRQFITPGHGVAESVKWLVGGVAPNGARLSDGAVKENTRQAARMLLLLREYERRFGMPDAGGARDEQWVLTELARGLYGGGTPLWTLKPVMSQAAEGLTGARGVDFALFPRTAFVFAPTSGSTLMFNMERGFNINKLTLMERVLVRMASFASNTRSVNEVDSNSPEVPELLRASRGESVQFGRGYHKEALAKEILDLASDGFGLFYLTSHATQVQAKVGEAVNGYARDYQEIQSFWTVESSIKELFTRLATIEAYASIVEIKKQVDAKPLYPRPIVLLFRVISSAGASGLWFGASWQDMIVAGLLGMMVAVFQGVTLWKHDRMILEVCASFVVGLLSGMISMSFPSTMCFGGMAVGAVIDILQGFRVVYSIMEIMSKNTVAGGADFLEAILFTGLIAYFLKFGMGTAKSILGVDEMDTEFNQCVNPISSYFYFLLVPITSLAWSALFTPRYSDIPLMMMHGIFSFFVYWTISTNTGNAAVATFVSAMMVTSSAGIFSRFTGRQALGDTVTGLYVLLPGAYLARGLFAAAEQNVIDAALLSNIVVKAVTIGLGGWTGTILCSPTILGTNRGLVNKSASSVRSIRGRQGDTQRSTQARPNAMLFF